MKTLLETIDPAHPEEDIILQAADFIKNGELVAFPTETVYGLGADALRPEASAKIYEAKGRPSDNPLIVHIADIRDLEKIADPVPAEAYLLAERFWPGPLTMILHKKDCVPKQTTGGLDTVAVRFPSHPVAQALILASGGFIAAPSANTSGRPSPTSAAHVSQDLDGKIAMILDGGEVGLGLESTIIDLSVPTPAILRPGFITKQMLEDMLSEVRGNLPDPNALEAPKAPGMKYRHYAPQAPVTLVRGDTDVVIRTIREQVSAHQADGERVGIICCRENVPAYPEGIVKCIGGRHEEAEIAHNLYRILREFDEEQVDRIYSEMFDTSGIGAAIMNRLLKAAGHKVMDVSDTETVRTETHMKEFDRIIFVGRSGNCREVMASEILKTKPLWHKPEILARGLVVLFPEPLNQKAEAIMAGKGFTPGNFMSAPLEETDITENTLVLTFEQSGLQKIRNKFPDIPYLYVLTDVSGDELEILDPTGQDLITYGICYETLEKSIGRLATVLNDDTFDFDKNTVPDESTEPTPEEPLGEAVENE